MNKDIVNNLFSIQHQDFSPAALELSLFQCQSNPVYNLFWRQLRKQDTAVSSIEQIPFLPVGFFKSHRVVTTEFTPEMIFKSSGTTQSEQSSHYIKSLELYEAAFLNGFIKSYGHPGRWCMLGLLPSYLERGQSSLVYMVKGLMEYSQHPNNDFFLNDWDKLYNTLKLLETNGQPTLLIGVTFALLDFAAQFRLQCSNTIVMETGGMKGRRDELTRDEVHLQLKQSFGVNKIHSEYGMTELLSQAYSAGDGLFRCPPWMKVLVRDEDDPLHIQAKGRGAINVIDLANVYSCSFIATDDVGEVYEDGSFRILGRMDNSDIRGCSLLAL